MQREILRPQIDVPLTVSLDAGPEGTEKEGRFGIDYQYSVNHNAALMYLPAAGRDALLKSGARSGDQVEILKGQRGKQHIFTVQVLSDAQEPAPPARKPAIGARNPEPQQTYDDGHGHRARFPKRTFAVPEPPPSNGHAKPEQPVRVIAENQAESDDFYAEQYVRCFRSGLIAAALCSQEAKKHGFSVAAPTWEDVRTIATTFFIEENKRANGGAR